MIRRTRSRLRFWWESRRFTSAAEIIRLPLGSLLLAGYLVTAIALVLPHETPLSPTSWLAHANTGLLVAIALVMVVVHGASTLGWLTGWHRKLLYLISSGVWGTWAFMLYEGGRHIGSAYATIFAFGALTIYWQLPTRGELRAD